MASSKDTNEGNTRNGGHGTDTLRNNALNRDDELPSYQAHPPPQHSTPLMPTVSSPFDFPTDEAPPTYTATTIDQRPIAIPQRYSDPAAPFLAAYPPVLLRHGIPSDTWYSFLDTLSAFLTAKVSKRAISHAGDVASSVVKMPQRFGKSVVDNAKSHAKQVTINAKHGNIPGVIGSVVGGVIGMTVGTAAGFVGHVLSTPGHAAGVAANPQTPRERAESYSTAANTDWLHKRGLHVQLCSTLELRNLLEVPLQQFLETANASNPNLASQLHRLADVIETVELQGEKSILDVRQTKSGDLISGYPADTKQGIQTHTSTGSSSTPIHSDAGVAGSSVGESSRLTSTRPHIAPLKVTAETLWLVLTRQ